MREAVLMGAVLLVVCSERITTLLKSVTSVGRAPLAKARRGHPTEIELLLVLLIGALSVPTITRAQSICQSCEVQLGLGGTYHFWGPTGGLELPRFRGRLVVLVPNSRLLDVHRSYQ